MDQKYTNSKDQSNLKNPLHVLILVISKSSQMIKVWVSENDIFYCKQIPKSEMSPFFSLLLQPCFKWQFFSFSNWMFFILASFLQPWKEWKDVIAPHEFFLDEV